MGDLLEAEQIVEPAERRAKKAPRKEVIPAKRPSKHAPMEVSSRRRPQKQAGATTSTRRDPRFEATSGELKSDLFRSTYGFLEEHEAAEIKQSGDKELLRRRVERQRRESERDVKSKLKRDERKAVAQGKKPFFLKRAQIKRKVLEQRFDDLRKRGKLDTFMRRKAKKMRRASSLEV